MNNNNNNNNNDQSLDDNLQHRILDMYENILHYNFLKLCTNK